jgi:hypothetical protein
MNDSFCSANITVVGAFFSPNEQITPISAHKCCKEGGRGAYLSCARPRQRFARFASVIDAQASCRRQAGIVALVVMVLLPLMCRHLCRRCDGVVALVVMALLPLPMRRHLAVVDNDGNSAKGNNNNDGATGDNEDDNPDNATDSKVNDDDGNGVTDNNIDDDCNGAMSDNNDDDVDNHDNVTGNNNDDANATDNDVDNNGNGATGNKVNNDGNSAMDDNIIEDCNGATDNDVEDNDGNGATDDDVIDDGHGATDNNIDNDCDGVTDNKVNNDGNGATGGRHCLDEAEACDNRRRNNQPANERQMGGEAPVDKRGRGLDRPRLRRAPPSRDLAATTLALAAKAAAGLIADNANGGNSGVAIVGSASLALGGGVTNKFYLVFVVNMIIFTGAPVMTMRPTGNPTGVLGVVATTDALDGRAVTIVWTREAAAR